MSRRYQLQLRRYYREATAAPHWQDCNSIDGTNAPLGQPGTKAEAEHQMADLRRIYPNNEYRIVKLPKAAK